MTGGTTKGLHIYNCQNSPFPDKVGILWIQEYKVHAEVTAIFLLISLRPFFLDSAMKSACSDSLSICSLFCNFFVEPPNQVSMPQRKLQRGFYQDETKFVKDESLVSPLLLCIAIKPSFFQHHTHDQHVIFAINQTLSFHSLSNFGKLIQRISMIIGPRKRPSTSVQQMVQSLPVQR